MIPLKLELKNFMAYREADPIDMTGLHVVVLTGENGAGKSTLLDAITWAVWGQARAKRDDELIAQGATEMRVAFTFGEGNAQYQIVRTRRMGKASKGKAASSSGSLDFFIRDESINGWRQISETRAADTQAKIERALNLGYETFINSAYLKQGRADEFTLKPPGQRKELLAEILNLGLWQIYEARAKDRLAAIEHEAARRELDLKQCEDELARLPEYERQLGEAQGSLRSAQEKLSQAEIAHRDMELMRERAAHQRAQAAQSEARIAALASELSALDSERSAHLQALQGYEAALNERAAIETGYAELEASRALNEQLNLKLTSMVDLSARKNAAEAAIADERRALESARDAARARLTDLERQSAHEDLAAKLLALQRQTQHLHAQQETAARLAAERLSSGEQQGEARAQNESLRREMNEIKQRIGALGSVGAICPTCGRELSEADRARLLGELNVRGKERGDLYRANDSRMKQLAEQRATLDAQIAAVTMELSAAPGLQREEAAVQERLDKAREAARSVPAARDAFDAAQQALDGARYAPSARLELARVETELAALGYDASEHKRLRDDALPRLAAFVQRKAELDRADLGVQSERRALESLDAQRAAQNSRIDAERAQLALQRAALVESERGLARAAEIGAALSQAQSEFFDAQRKVGAANQRVQACGALQDTSARLRREIAAFERQTAQLDELREAYGKNGVPAMIIESVLPELEASANDLLGRMSNGRMNVRFETQRLTQKGDASETLEIRIADEIGERAYEMFSGGEAFRINFAVRIALSKLLARRAGARLRTLFIDEGFGTQDAQGRERLVEAIRTIEDDFERLFIITHIDELRDAFPARIEVTKTPRGSFARVA